MNNFCILRKYAFAYSNGGVRVEGQKEVLENKIRRKGETKCAHE